MNKSFLSSKLETRPNPAKGGMGVFAVAHIAAGELLVVWGGRIVDGAELATLPSHEQMYSIQVDENAYQVTWPGQPPEAADFVNHACSPNAGLRGQISLVALRAIAPGEEINFDYAMSDGSPYDEFVCGCGSDLCRRYITGSDWRRPDLQVRYYGYFSPYIARRIEQQNAIQPALSANGVAKAPASDR